MWCLNKDLREDKICPPLWEKCMGRETQLVEQPVSLLRRKINFRILRVTMGKNESKRSEYVKLLKTLLKGSAVKVHTSSFQELFCFVETHFLGSCNRGQ